MLCLGESPDKPKTLSFFVFVATLLSLLALRATALSLLLLVHKTLDVIRQGLDSDQRTITLLLLLQHVRVLKVVLQLGCSLDPCIADLTDLVGVELFPGAMMKLAVKVLNEFGVDEVEEGVTDVAIVLYRPSRTL